MAAKGLAGIEAHSDGSETALSTLYLSSFYVSSYSSFAPDSTLLYSKAAAAGAPLPRGPGGGDDAFGTSRDRAVGHYMVEGDSEDNEQALPIAVQYSYRQCINRLLDFSLPLKCQSGRGQACTRFTKVKSKCT
ncbi:hypothetical protein FHETE_7450 [Fusarium heterosporum]|uniref:Uncharacterized protein n=1 Tax=Fusarium heterosporum TaxID=42747 RepID=A0A8H5T168_FUSHE|nr:hypothetical protein FHETE_7450 [Fusarium heterosporum]